eukprot:Sspe_Gene.37382::Locus_18043_Transcript_1_1_Confidence_1.000_Length_1464::g.37382::m.37382
MLVLVVLLLVGGVVCDDHAIDLKRLIDIDTWSHLPRERCPTLYGYSLGRCLGESLPINGSMCVLQALTHTSSGEAGGVLGDCIPAAAEVGKRIFSESKGVGEGWSRCLEQSVDDKGKRNFWEYTGDCVAGCGLGVLRDYLKDANRSMLVKRCRAIPDNTPSGDELRRLCYIAMGTALVASSSSFTEQLAMCEILGTNQALCMQGVALATATSAVEKAVSYHPSVQQGELLEPMVGVKVDPAKLAGACGTGDATSLFNLKCASAVGTALHVAGAPEKSCSSFEHMKECLTGFQKNAAVEEHTPESRVKQCLSDHLPSKHGLAIGQQVMFTGHTHHPSRVSGSLRYGLVGTVIRLPEGNSTSYVVNFAGNVHHIDKKFLVPYTAPPPVPVTAHINQQTHEKRDDGVSISVLVGAIGGVLALAVLVGAVLYRKRKQQTPLTAAS